MAKIRCPSICKIQITGQSGTGQERISEVKSDVTGERKLIGKNATNFLMGTLHNWVFVFTSFKVSKLFSPFFPGLSEGMELA